MTEKQSALDLLVGWRRLIYRVTVAAVVVSVAVSLLLHNWYEASATFVPPQETGARTGLMSMFSQIGIDIGGERLLSSTPRTDLIIGVLKSRQLRGRVVDRFNLMEVYRSDSRDRAIEDLGDRIVVDTTPEGMVEVRVEDRDRQRAADMSNAFVEFLDQYNRAASVDRARRTREFVEDALTENAERLAAASEALQAFQEEHGTVDLPEQTQATVSAIASLEADRTKLVVRRGVLEDFSSPSRMEMREIDAELQEVQKQIDLLTGKGAGVPPDSGGDATLLPLSSIPELVGQLADLTREVEVQEKVRLYLSSQLEESRIQETRDLETVQVVDRAVPPLKKSRPRRSMIVILTVCLAFVGSVGIAFLADSVLRYAQGPHSGSGLSASREMKLLVGLAQRLDDWGGPPPDEDSS